MNPFHFGKARFLSPTQIKRIRKWLDENGYKKKSSE